VPKKETSIPRPVKSDISVLLQEARAMELLADEVDVPFDHIQAYWALSTDLIALVADIEQLQAELPALTYEDPRLFALRHRLRDIASRLGALEVE
jgi:hypothetical protein